MSRFQIDKLMAYVDGDGGRVREYASDPVGFVDGWVTRASRSRTPTADSGELTAEERRAFESVDIGALYAMGAHPYILLHFARSVDVVTVDTPWPRFVEEYRSNVAPHGFPDFAT